MKKITVSSELIYILAVILLSLAVAILTSANFGISMIVAPAYLLSLKIGVITFGQAEYYCSGVRVCFAVRSFKRVQTYISDVLFHLHYLRRCFGPVAQASVF